MGGRGVMVRRGMSEGEEEAGTNNYIHITDSLL